MPIWSSWFIVIFSSTISLLNFCRLDPSIINTKILKSSVTIEDSCISSHSIICFCLSVFWYFAIGIYTLRFFVFLVYWSFYRDAQPSLSLIIFLDLKSVLSKNNIVIPASLLLVLLWYIIFYPVTFNLSLYLK